MDSKIILGRLLQRFIDQGYTQVENYTRFEFIKLRKSSVMVSRQNGKDTAVPFEKILVAIEGYKMHPDDYMAGPANLRIYGLSYITSPIFSLLHLLPVTVYTD